MKTIVVPPPPNQPLRDRDHFLPNELVVKLSTGRVDMGRLLRGEIREFSVDDLRQVHQLLGIRVDEYCRLSVAKAPDKFTLAEPATISAVPQPTLEQTSDGWMVRNGATQTGFGDLTDASHAYAEAYVAWKARIAKDEERRGHDTPGMQQPMQPLYFDEQRARQLRFRQNEIVDYLLDHAGFDLNKLALVSFPHTDRMQFAQLIGYSLSGYGELSYVTDDSYDEAERMAVLLESVPREAEA